MRAQYRVEGEACGAAGLRADAEVSRAGEFDRVEFRMGLAVARPRNRAGNPDRLARREETRTIALRGCREARLRHPSAIRHGERRALRAGPSPRPQRLHLD